MRQNLIIGGIVLLLIIVWGWTQFQLSPTVVAPTWNGITPSQTTREEVLAILGEPDNTFLCVVLYEGSVLRRYETECEQTTEVVQYGYYNEQLSGKLYGWNEIHFNPNGTVDYIVETKWPDPNGAILSKEALLLQNGSPEQVVWSRRGVSVRGLLYCERGLIFHTVLGGSIKTLRFTEVVYFAPMSTDQCIDKFSNEITTTYPYEGSDVEGSLDPWGLQ